MRRWIFRIVVGLILGAFTTIAIAWERAWTAPRTSMRYRSYSATDESTSTRYYRMDRPGRVMMSSERDIPLIIRSMSPQGLQGAFWPYPPHPAYPEEISPREILPFWTNIDEATPSFIGESRWMAAFGWPAISMCYGAKCGVDRHGTIFQWTYGGAVDPRSWQGPAIANRVEMHKDKFLPLRPVWPGFLIDSMFYGSIWFALVFAFVSAKRMIRTGRGRCPRCGYDLRGHRMNHGRDARATDSRAIGCPECGWRRTGGPT